MPVVLYFSVIKHNIQVSFRVFNIESTNTCYCKVFWWQVLAVTNKSLFYLLCCQSEELLFCFCSEEVPSQSRLFRVSV